MMFVADSDSAASAFPNIMTLRLSWTLKNFICDKLAPISGVTWAKGFVGQVV